MYIEIQGGIPHCIPDLELYLTIITLDHEV